MERHSVLSEESSSFKNPKTRNEFNDLLRIDNGMEFKGTVLYDYMKDNGIQFWDVQPELEGSRRVNPTMDDFKFVKTPDLPICTIPSRFQNCDYDVGNLKEKSAISDLMTIMRFLGWIDRLKHESR